MKIIKSTILSIIVILFLSSCSENKDNFQSTNIKLPISSKNINKKNYKVVVNQLKDAGFTDVKTDKIEDLVTGWLKKDGEIESVTINGDTDFTEGQEFPKNAKITVIYHTFKEDKSENKETKDSTQKKDKNTKKNSSSSSVDTKSSPSSSKTSSSSTTTSSSSSQASSNTSDTPTPSETQVINPDNNPEFASILKTEDPTTISNFVQKFKGKVVEFNGYIAYFNPHGNYKTRYDILIYAGDYPGPDLASPGPAFQFNDVAPTSVFRNFSGDGIGIGQNIHIKATIREFSTGELFILDPIEVTER